MENNYHTIKYMDEDVKCLQYLSESNSMFSKRLEYIKKLETAKVNWKEANRISKIWYCIKFKSCKYLPEVYHNVIKYDK